MAFIPNVAATILNAKDKLPAETLPLMWVLGCWGHKYLNQKNFYWAKDSLFGKIAPKENNPLYCKVSGCSPTHILSTFHQANQNNDLWF